jgi:3-hydroxy-3-methylglutaryl CoA synthase
MSSIKTYGVYLPQFTIEDNVLHPKGGSKKHTVGYVDEDIITLAYASACNLQSEVDAVLFATSTPIFKGRYHASYLADMMSLKEGILALDLGTTDRSGTDALVLADALVQAGKCQNVLVVASNISYPPIGSELKTPFGHGAVSMIISTEPGLAAITGTASYSSAVAEEFIYKGDKVKYDARFAVGVGFKENIKRVLGTFDSGSIDNLIVNSTYSKFASGTLKKLGFKAEGQLMQDTLAPQIGYLGAAHGLFRLIDMIENRTGNSALLDYANGSNVISLDVRETSNEILGKALQSKAEINSYQDYLTIRKQGKFNRNGYEHATVFSSEMMQEREKEQLIGLKGFECSGCGTIIYMKAARCSHCKEEEFHTRQLATKGKIFTKTSEHYFPASFPPTNMIVVDLDGGGRITVQQTDDMYQNEEASLNIGDKVELTLRMMMENDAKPNYFWKCRPIKN